LGSAIINERYLCDNISLAAWEWEIVVQDMHLNAGLLLLGGELGGLAGFGVFFSGV